MSKVRLVVPYERHVERLAVDGIAAETRTSLRRRLLARFAPDVRLAAPEATRALLSHVVPQIAARDPIAARLAARGGAALQLLVDAVDDAVSELRAAAVDANALRRLTSTIGGGGARARFLADALCRLDEALASAGLVDGRVAGQILARALGAAEPSAVRDEARADVLAARWILRWDAQELAWWRALDRAMTRAGGRAMLELPVFDRPLDATRRRDPFERITEALSAALEDPPGSHLVPATLGDLTLASAPPADLPARVSVRSAADADAQARAVADAVVSALEAGAPVDAIAVAVPAIDEEVLSALRDALDDVAVPCFDSRGPAPLGSGIVRTALDALALGPAGLPRHGVAALLRSAYVDAQAVVGESRGARRRLLELAAVLEGTPTVRASDPVTTLAETARASDGPPEARAARGALAARVGELLRRTARSATREEHARAAVAVWEGLGIDPRDRAVLSVLGRDGPRRGLERAELRALARDDHAWELLRGAVDRTMRMAREVGLEAEPCAPEAFLHEIVRALEAGVPPPGAGRAAAVRIARLPELAGEPLACLVVVDAMAGCLPPQGCVAPLLGDALLRRVAQPPLPSRSLARAQALAELGLAAAHAEHVVLVHRRRASDGTAFAPSPLVDWVVRAGAAVSEWSARPIPIAPRTRREARLALVAGGRSVAEELAPSAVRRARTELAREEWHLRRRPSVAAGQIELDPIAATALAARTGAVAALPVTMLDELAKCPFRGFASLVAGRAIEERVEETPSALEEGRLVHRALELAFVAAAPLLAARPRDRAAILREGERALGALLAGAERTSGLRRASALRARDEALALLDRAVDDERWDFHRAEISFGGSDDAWAPLLLEGDAGPVLLRGKIDRLDRARQRAAVRVVDYKRSKAAASPAELGRQRLQLLAYALVAAREEGAARVDGAYLSTVEPAAPSPKWEASWAAWLADGGEPARRRILDVVGAVRGGDVLPKPGSPCGTCAFDGACRRPRFAATPPSAAEAETTTSAEEGAEP
jgi:hypothetical protein